MRAQSRRRRRGLSDFLDQRRTTPEESKEKKDVKIVVFVEERRRRERRIFTARSSDFSGHQRWSSPMPLLLDLEQHLQQKQHPIFPLSEHCPASHVTMDIDNSPHRDRRDVRRSRLTVSWETTTQIVAAAANYDSPKLARHY